MTTAATSLLDAALAYAARGWAVFPIAPQRKTPLFPSAHPEGDPLRGKCVGACRKVGHGFYDATTDATVIRAWWTHAPTANIGIATGRRSNLSVLDVDGQAGIASLSDHKIHPPLTLSIKTPRGFHLYYQFTPTLREGAGFLPGIDVRNDGGYVVAPPSEVDGLPYTVFRPGDPTPYTAPADVFLARSRQVPAAEATGQVNGHQPGWITTALANGAPEGTRNAMATRLAGYFHAKGHPTDVIVQMMQGFAAKCQPPMDTRELLRTIASVERYAVTVQEAHVTEPPEFTDKGGVWEYRFSSEQITFHLDQMDYDKEGLHAEVSVDWVGEHYNAELYGPTRLNLSSTRSRTELTNALAKRRPADWPTMLDSVSRIALTQYRTGEPIVDLRDHMDDPTPQWSLCPLVVEDGISILFGDGGVGKSNIALAVLLALETGNERVLGLTPVTRHKGLYMDWEANAQSHAKRYRRLTKGLGIAPVKLRYMRCDSPLHEMRQAVKRRVAEEGISFIIIDSAAAACGGEPEKAAMALQLCNAIRFVGVTALIIAHQTKDAMASRKPFGSVFWNNVARSTVEVINQQEPGEDAIHVGLFHRKVNDGRLERPFGRTILFTPESITIVAENLSENPELSKKLSNWMRIQAIMRGKMTNAEIAEASGVNLNSVAATMRRAQHQGLVDELADGRWFLVSRREEGQ